MVRVTNGLQRQRKHKKYLSQAKWFRQGRSKVYNQVRQALIKQGQHAYTSRRLKCYTKDIELNRKVLSNIALAFPEVFNKICEEVTK